MTDIQTRIERMERHAHAPEIVEKAGREYETEALAEVASAVEVTLRDECQERDIGKHGGIGVLYLVVDRLAEAGESDDENGEGDTA